MRAQGDFIAWFGRHAIAGPTAPPPPRKAPRRWATAACPTAIPPTPKAPWSRPTPLARRRWTSSNSCRVLSQCAAHGLQTIHCLCNPILLQVNHGTSSFMFVSCACFWFRSQAPHARRANRPSCSPNCVPAQNPDPQKCLDVMSFPPYSPRCRQPNYALRINLLLTTFGCLVADYSINFEVSKSKYFSDSKFYNT